jgi:hypothetical protein
LVPLVAVPQHLETHELINIVGRQRCLIELHAELVHADCGNIHHRFASRRAGRAQTGRF